MKKNLVSMVDEYPNLDLICNARSDSVIYDLVPAPTGRKGIPAKHRKSLSIDEDFALSDEKIGDYYTGVRHVLTNLFGKREVLAYVTATTKESGTKRLFFSTIFPEQLEIFCAWHENRLAAIGCSISHYFYIHSNGILKSVIMNRKPSVLYAVI